MAKLKNIIQQLSLNDYTAIYNLLNENSAEKSAYLLKNMRERSTTDTALMKEIDVNHNAYYTLRSRLNQKIEEYLLQQMESPKTNLIKKVANINEVIFTKKPAIAITTLKKLEKELLDYDLSNELISVYKALKKLYANTSEAFQYSQLYNRRVAYTLAVDKAEQILVDYFNSFGLFTFSGDETEQTALSMISTEMDNVCNLYQSHRLFIYQNCLSVIQRLFVDNPEYINQSKPPLEDILDEMKQVFETYSSDATYFYLQKVYSYLKLLYYTKYMLFQKAEDYFEDINENISSMLSNYNYFTFPSYFLYLKIERSLRMECEHSLYNPDDVLSEIEDDYIKNNTAQYIYLVMYKAIACYYSSKFDEAAKHLNNLLNNLTLKKYPFASLEIKSVLALQYCCMNDLDLFKQISSSIQRQIRVLGKDSCDDILLFNKILKIAVSNTKKDKRNKIIETFKQLNRTDKTRIFNPIRLIKINDAFLENII